MKCKPTGAPRLNHTALFQLIDTFEDRTERIDAAAMALDLLVGNIDTEKAHFAGPAYKSGAEELERMGDYLRMAYVAAYTIRREVAALNDAFSGLLAASAPQHGGNQSTSKKTMSGHTPAPTKERMIYHGRQDQKNTSGERSFYAGL